MENRPYRCKDRRIGPKAMKFFTQSRARCGRVIESMNVFGRDVHSLSRTCLANRAARLVERRLRFRQSARDTRQFEISSAHSAAPSPTHGSSDLRHTSVAACALRDVGSAVEETPYQHVYSLPRSSRPDRPRCDVLAPSFPHASPHRTRDGRRRVRARRESRDPKVLSGKARLGRHIPIRLTGTCSA